MPTQSEKLFWSVYDRLLAQMKKKQESPERRADIQFDSMEVISSRRDEALLLNSDGTWSVKHDLFDYDIGPSEINHILLEYARMIDDPELEEIQRKEWENELYFEKTYISQYEVEQRGGSHDSRQVADNATYIAGINVINGEFDEEREIYIEKNKAALLAGFIFILEQFLEAE